LNILGWSFAFVCGLAFALIGFVAFCAGAWGNLQGKLLTFGFLGGGATVAVASAVILINHMLN